MAANIGQIRDNTTPMPWLYSARWDWFWIMSGIWLLVPIVILSKFPHGLDLLLAGSLVILWLAHRIGTTYISFTKQEYLVLIKTQYVRFIVIPVMVFLFFLMFFFDPFQIVPLSPLDKAKLGLTVYFFFNSYHFAYQHYGILSIYRARANQALSDGSKQMEKIYSIVVAGVVVTIGLILKGSAVLDSTFMDTFWVTSTAALLLKYATIVGTIIVLLVTALVLRSELSQANISVPKILYVASISLQGVLVFFIDPVAFFILWAIQHWLVSIGLTAKIAPPGKTAGAHTAMWYRFWDNVNRRSFGTLTVLLLVSVIMAPLFVGATNPEKIASVGMFLKNHSALVNILLTLSVGSAFVHLNMDRAIFRFSNEAVRKVSLPLIFRTV